MPLKILISVIFMASVAFPSDLDSLITKNREMTKKLQNMKGFLLSHHIERPASARHFQPIAPVPSPVSNMPMYEERRLDQMEISITKLTMVCEELQKQSEDLSSHQEFFVKIFETLMGSITTIAVALIGYTKFRKKSV